MGNKAAVIKCRKCGYISNIISDTCLKCGAELEKICGACGFANEVEKNYCDQCGILLALRVKEDAPKTTSSGHIKVSSAEREVASFKVELQPIQDTVSEKEASFRSQLNQDKNNTSPKPAEKTPARTDGKSDRGKKSSVRGKLPESSRNPKTQGVILKRFITAVLLAACGVLIYVLAMPHIPRISLIITANRYLGYLAKGRYAQAYELLSGNSKTVCTLKDFTEYSHQYYSRIPAWEFRAVEPFSLSQDGAMVKYELREGTGPWHEDYISFVKEHNSWKRPYIWMLFEPIENAIAKQDYTQALFLAQKLYLTDPIDPRSSGYLCAAEYFMGVYDKAAESCQKTLSAAEVYPVGFSAAEIFRYKFYYADSLSLSRNYVPAIKEYNELLKRDEIPQDDKCSLLLSRADAFVRLIKYDDALNDMFSADAVCLGDSRKEFERRMRFMNGEGRAEAVQFAQKSKSRAGMPSFLELRRESREPGRDEWVSAHVAGPEYRVIVRRRDPGARVKQKGLKEIYAFAINLWTGSIKLERGK